MDAIFLDTIESIRAMQYAKLSAKAEYIDHCLCHIDRLKLFAELAWENKLFATKQFGELIGSLESIGKELGGWKKNLMKTPATKTGEAK